jgi:pyruvate dehydrogenase E2 component (dihydrolipoamide acetyltransferase)
MAELIRMPKMSDTMTDGVIAEWHKKVGDVVKSGDVLAEVETDKATMDLEAYDEGTLLYIGVEKGQSVPVDGVLAVIGQPGDDFQALLNGQSGGSQAAPAAPVTPAVAQEAAKKAADTLTGAANVAPATTELPDAKSVAAAPAMSANATVIRMPKMSDTMTEGTIVVWHKQEGDAVKSGDVLAEVETDKATMDLEAYDEGTLLYIGVKAGDVVAVDAVLAVVGEKGANFKVLLDGGTPGPADQSAPKPAANPAVAAATATNGQATAEAATEADGRVKASPLAKRIAEDKGINLAQVHGSGPDGRIVRKDVETFKPVQSAAPAVAPVATPAPAAAPAASQPASVPASAPAMVAAPATGDFEDLPISQMRKTIARRLSESMFTAPHFYLTMEITMDKAMTLRPQLNEVSPAKISFNDMVIKASALALKQHPAVNSAWLGDKIRRYNYVNVGVAVAVDEGLLVPVVRDADKKTMSVIATEVKEMAGKAKDKKLQPKDWEGNTFSISNLGMFGIDEFTAIINPPDACILAVGTIKQTAAFREDGTVYPTNIMKVTLSCDHRVVDGASGSAFLKTLKDYLENPMKLLV